MDFNELLKKGMLMAGCTARELTNEECSCEYEAYLGQDNLIPHEITNLKCRKKIDLLK